MAIERDADSQSPPIRLAIRNLLRNITAGIIRYETGMSPEELAQSNPSGKDAPLTPTSPQS